MNRLISLGVLALSLTAAPAYAEEVATEAAISTEAEAPEASASGAEEPVAEEDDSISGGIAVVDKYGFSDLFVQTDGPTAQAWLSIPVGFGGCSVELFASHGLDTRTGREVDIGGACAFNVAEDVEVSLTASRYILGGATDITMLEGKVTVGQFDAALIHYVVDGAEENATKFELGYTLGVTDRFSLRAVGVYETGFDLPDIVVGGVEARYALGGGFALTANAYAPLHRGAGDPRSAQVFLGVSFDF